MSQTYSLDEIVRRLDRKPDPASLDASSRLIVFDARARKVLAREPYFKVGRDLRYFQVATRPEYVECRGPICRIKSTELQAACEIAVDYDVRCEPGREAQLVSFLQVGAQPIAALNAFVSGCVQRFFAEQAATGRIDVCLDLFGLLPELKSYLTLRASEAVGLALVPTVRVPQADKLAASELRTGFFTVRVRDYDREIELKLATDLEVDAAYKMRAVVYVHLLTSVEERVRKLVRRVLLEEVTLQSFCYELDGSVRLRLIGALNDMLAAEGRRISYLELASPEVSARPAELEEVEHTVECRIHDYEKKIVVKHHLQLTVGDLGRFRRADIEDLHRWMCQRLDTITRSVLFDLNYVDLLLDGGHREIRDWMERESLAVGYRVKQLITVPALAPLVWKDGLPLVPFEDSYVTKSSRVEVRLSIVVKGRISNLRDERLKPYLTPNSRLADDMHALIHRETQLLMYKVEPQRFYMFFDVSLKGKPSLRQEIEQRLAEALVERFAVDGDDITIFAAQLDTEITLRLAALQKKVHHVEVTCLSHRDGGLSEEVKYSIYFSILGVAFEGWHTFISRQFASREEELEAIQDLLREDAQTILQTVPQSRLQYIDVKTVADLQALLAASDRIVAGFGLVISIVNLKRESTTGEQEQQRVLQEDIRIVGETAVLAAAASARSKREELAMLELKRRELEDMGVGRDDPTLRDVTRRIGALTGEVVAYPSPRDKRHVAARPGRSDGSFNLDDYALRSLPGRPEAKLLREQNDGDEP